MSERVISPGVFTKEIDQSFLPQAVSQIGGAFIGPTMKGPAFVPTVVTSYNDFIDRFGSASPTTFLPYCVQSYLRNSGFATIVRILPSKGYQVNNPVKLTCESNILCLIVPSANGLKNQVSIIEAGLTGSLSGSDLFSFYISGSREGSPFTWRFDNVSLIPNRSNYIGKILSTSPDTSKDFYLYLNFEEKSREITNVSPHAKVVTASISPANTLNFSVGNNAYGPARSYSHAQTPWITSQLFGVAPHQERYDLFKIHTIGDGDNMNYEYKISISDIRTPNALVGEEYGSFTLSVRRFRDSDTKPEYIEVFQNLNINPDSNNYIARVIGDRFGVFNENTKKIDYFGEFPNKSKFIRVEMSPIIRSVPKESVPFGFDALFVPIGGEDSDDVGDVVPIVKFIETQGPAGQEEFRTHFGFDFGYSDNLNYLKPLPAITGQGIGINVSFGLDENAKFYTSSMDPGNPIDPYNNTSLYMQRKKFSVPFQGGFNGANPAEPKYTGGDGVYSNGSFALANDYLNGRNIFGFDCSGPEADGTKAYRKAIDILANQDEYDINLLVIPGIISSLHGSVAIYAKNMVENRGDCFYIMDICTINSSVEAAISNVQGMDTNYVAAYYPWVKIQDFENNRTVWVPPSVVVAGVYSFNDRIGFEWFAPAGLTRGGLTDVIEARTRLSRQERDDLYSNRINPLATFPGQGVVVWGQKTLQVRASALDRINVRRLLINIKKFIASTARFILFETAPPEVSRNRFLNLVNPYLEGIKQRSGIYKFRVISDETNNSNEDYDRGILRAEIILQPTKTTEFIVVPLIVRPTGASFEGI